MKATVYLRVAKTARGPKVSATNKPMLASLMSGSGYKAKPLPTVAFAITLDVPDEAFKQAERVIAELTIPKESVVIAAEVAEVSA